MQMIMSPKAKKTRHYIVLTDYYHRYYKMALWVTYDALNYVASDSINEPVPAHRIPMWWAQA